jgi:hypothetical protein
MSKALGPCSDCGTPIGARAVTLNAVRIAAGRHWAACTSTRMMRDGKRGMAGRRRLRTLGLLGIYEGRWTAGPAPNPSAIFASKSLHESVPGSATPDSLRAVPNTLRSSNFLTGLSGCERIVVRNDDLLSVRRELLSVKGNVSARWALRWRTEGPSSPPAPVPSVRLRKPRLPSRGFSLSRSTERWPRVDRPGMEAVVSWPQSAWRRARLTRRDRRSPGDQPASGRTLSAARNGSGHFLLGILIGCRRAR